MCQSQIRSQIAFLVSAKFGTIEKMNVFVHLREWIRLINLIKFDQLIKQHLLMSIFKVLDQNLNETLATPFWKQIEIHVVVMD